MFSGHKESYDGSSSAASRMEPDPLRVRKVLLPLFFFITLSDTHVYEP